MKKLAVALTASTDWLLFEEDERGPDDDLRLQFEALRQFDEEDRKTAASIMKGRCARTARKASRKSAIRSTNSRDARFSSVTVKK